MDGKSAEAPQWSGYELDASGGQKVISFTKDGRVSITNQIINFRGGVRRENGRQIGNVSIKGKMS